MYKKQSGQIIIISLVFMAIILLLTGAVFGYIGLNVKAGRSSLATEQALQMVDAGIDKAIWKLNTTAGAYAGESGTVLGTVGEFDVSIATISGTLKEITTTAYVPNRTAPRATKQAKVQVQTNTQVISFNYGVQVGDGGLDMSNNAQVNGSVYSNGPITIANGARITGTANSAGASGLFDGNNNNSVDGSVYAHTIRDTTIGGSAFGYSLSNTTVGGNAEFYSISSCTIGGNASYTTKTSCTIGGSQTTPYAGYPDPAAQDFPISDQQIADWKTQAAAGGTLTGSYTLTNQSQASLGPKKITGDLTISNGSTLTITGPLWVQGTITLQNQSVIRLDPSYGNLSEALVADGVISITNNGSFQGAGAGSYILLITTSNSTSAFNLNNQTSTMIAFARNGTVVVSNNAGAKEVLGYRIQLQNQATITYESGLANLNFAGGPGGSWQLVRGTWRITD